MNKLTKKY